MSMATVPFRLQATTTPVGGAQLFQMTSEGNECRRITITVKTGDPLLALAVGSVTKISTGVVDYEP